MKRVLAILLLVAVCLTGCGTDTTVSMPEQQAMRCDELLEALLTVAEVECDITMDYDDADYDIYCQYWYDLPIQFIGDGVITYVTAGNNADEISILYPQSEVTYETVKKALSRRPERQIEHYTGLHDAQAVRYESDECQIAECEGFLLLVVAENANEVIEKFYEILSD